MSGSLRRCDPRGLISALTPSVILPVDTRKIVATVNLGSASWRMNTGLRRSVTDWREAILSWLLRRGGRSRLFDLPYS